MSADARFFIHSLADVQSSTVGEGTRIWQFVVVLPGVRIGANCNICSHCFIENDVEIGDRVTIKNGVQLWDGLRVEDDVFIGPNVTFTNDSFPRSLAHQKEPLRTILGTGASIGAGATILPGLKIGKCAMVGAGAVVTRSVPPNAIVVGNPATIVGYVDAITPSPDERKRGTEGSAKVVYGSTGVSAASALQFPVFTDIRGSLTAGEFLRDIPFRPMRYFMVFSVPSRETRGAHAHKVCHQFLVCVRGTCSVVVDDGSKRAEISLDSPQRGLYVPPMTWSVQYKYSPDALLLVFASHHYDAGDYIRDYDEFLRLCSKGRPGVAIP